MQAYATPAPLWFDDVSIYQSRSLVVCTVMPHRGCEVVTGADAGKGLISLCAVCLWLCRSHLLYYSVIVAQEDIPAFTELTYNYYYKVSRRQLALASSKGERCGCSQDTVMRITASSSNSKKQTCFERT
jgi:hypothetical protein